MAYYFDSAFKVMNMGKNACIYGNCDYGYGIKDYNGRGVFEGKFSGGDPISGIYHNPTKKGGKGGVRWMKKIVKKGSFGSRLVYDGFDFKKPTGFILE
jgi:hypothetical protein